jgi:hypothetical protein
VARRPGALLDSVRYSRRIGITNYYWGDKNVAFPLGSIQSGGGVLRDPHNRVSLRGKRLQIFYQANNLEGPRPAGQSLARHDPEAGGRATHPGGAGGTELSPPVRPPWR